MEPGFFEVENTSMSNAPGYTVGRVLPIPGAWGTQATALGT